MKISFGLKKAILLFFLMTASLKAYQRDTNTTSSARESNSFWKWLVSFFGGDEQPRLSKNHPPKKGHPLIEFKGGYFFFSNPKMRRVYNQGGLDVQICGSYPLISWLDIYGSVEFLTRNGRSIGGHEKTTLWQIPLSLGLKPVIAISSAAQYYITFGPRYFFIHASTHSHSLDRTINTNGLGGFINTGFNFFPYSHLLVDVFGEYSYKKIHFHPPKSGVHGRSIQVGGFAFGAGLGYAF